MGDAKVCPKGFIKKPANFAVKTKIGKASIIFVKGREYSWNSAYKLYNATDGYNQLLWRDLGVEICVRK